MHGSISSLNGWSHLGTVYLLQMNIFVAFLLLNVSLTQLIYQDTSCSVFNSNPPRAGRGAKLFAPLRFSRITPVRVRIVGISRCVSTYFLGHSIRTLWWFAHRQIHSGYPVATCRTDAGLSFFILISEKGIIISTSVNDQW